MSKNNKAGPAIKVKDHTLLANELDYEVVSDRQIKFTEARAQEFLELPIFQGERSATDRHVQFLYDQWSTGRFVWEQVQIGLCILGGKTYRINGQHTCWMRWNIGSKLKEEPQVRETTYRVKTEEALRALYCTFDRNKPRSSGHSLKALLVGQRCTDGLWSTTIGNLAIGLRMWRFGDTDQASRMTAEDMAVLVTEQYPDLFLSTGRLFQELYDSFNAIRRTGVIAALFATMESQPNKAHEFWGPVATGLNLTEKTDARYALRKWLTETTRGAAHKTISTPEETYRVCINAWNKWRKSQPMSVVRATEERVKAI